MPDDIPILDPESMRRIGQTVRRSEAAARTPGGESTGRRPPDPVQLLKITGPVSGGLYPAKVSWWDDAAATETLSEAVRWKPRTGATPAVNDYVFGRYSGPTADGEYGLYQGVQGGGGAGGPVVTVAIPWRFDADPENPCTFIPVVFKYLSGPGLTLSDDPPED